MTYLFYTTCNSTHYIYICFCTHRKHINIFLSIATCIIQNANPSYNTQYISITHIEGTHIYRNRAKMGGQKYCHCLLAKFQVKYIVGNTSLHAEQCFMYQQHQHRQRLPLHEQGKDEMVESWIRFIGQGYKYSLKYALHNILVCCILRLFFRSMDLLNCFKRGAPEYTKAPKF